VKLNGPSSDLAEPGAGVEIDTGLVVRISPQLLSGSLALNSARELRRDEQKPIK
jgi:hypothetical protein